VIRNGANSQAPSVYVAHPYDRPDELLAKNSRPGTRRPRHFPEGVLFIKTELEIGLAFSKMALNSNNVEKVARNPANARRAYEAALRFVTRVLLTHEDSIEVGQDFGQHKAELVSLGQRFWHAHYPILLVLFGVVDANASC
jgi:hypothetical protein